MTCLKTFPQLYDSVNVKKTNSESVVNLHTPRSNEGHQGKTDGENNPQPHVWMMMTTSSKETDSRGPAVLKILNVKPIWGVYRSLMQSALYTISTRTENPPKKS